MSIPDWSSSSSKYLVAECAQFAKGLWRLPTYHEARERMIRSLFRWSDEGTIVLHRQIVRHIAWRAAAPGESFTIEDDERAWRGPFVDATLTLLALPVAKLPQEAGYPAPDVRHRFWTALALLSPAQSVEELADHLPPLPPAFDERALQTLCLLDGIEDGPRALRDDVLKWRKRRPRVANPTVVWTPGGRKKGTVSDDSEKVALRHYLAQLHTTGMFREQAREWGKYFVQSQQWYTEELKAITENCRTFKHRDYTALYSRALKQVDDALEPLYKGTALP